MAYKVKWIEPNGLPRQITVEYHPLAVSILKGLIVDCKIYNGKIVKVKG